MLATKTDTGTPGASDSTMPPTADTSAKITDATIAAAGDATTRAAAAAGVMSSRPAQGERPGATAARRAGAATRTTVPLEGGKPTTILMTTVSIKKSPTEAREGTGNCAR